MFHKRMILAIALSIAIAGTAVAQNQGGGDFQITPAMKAKMDAWRKWRDNHKNVSALQQTLGGLNAIAKDSKSKFTAAQAKTISAVLNKWKAKKSITDAEARTINTAITKPLTTAQLKVMARAQQEFGRRRGGPGGGGPGGGFGGGNGGNRTGNGGGGGQRGFDPSKMPSPKDYNPLNPSTIPQDRMKERAKTNMDILQKALKTAAAGK